MDEKKDKKHTTLKKGIVLIVTAVIFGIGACTVIQLKNYSENKKNSSAFEVPAIEETEQSEIEEVVATVAPEAINVSTSDVSGVVDRIMPSIVSINCKSTIKQQDFWGQIYEYETASNGSGIIIGQNNTEVLIVTNNHVVEDAKEVEVVLADDTKVTASVKGTDSSYDLAVVAVDINDLEKETIDIIKIATLGDSDELERGSMVIAIGNALGYGQSVTVGYVGALDREITVDGDTRTLLQIDAAINPGNSGGALLDSRGAVIGINSVKYTDSSVEGMGYAIPISTAIPVINELMNREELSEDEAGYLGITGKNIKSNDVQSFNMPIGIYVYSVEDDSPAKNAGLKVGDIIIGFNGRKITSMEELQIILSYTRTETQVELQIKVLENGEYVEKTVPVVLGKRPKK